ncbi:MAG TPA: serine hydrolase [Cyclobacteriaceae bacterium]|nr:serine hydrolase [Cyclobacteriaceae bacterium]
MKISIGVVACTTAIGFYSVCCTIFNKEKFREALTERERISHVTEEVNVKKRKSPLDSAIQIYTDHIDTAAWAKGTFPAEKWQSVMPDRVGWNTAKLDVAKEYFEQLNADACMIIQNGFVIGAWGDVSKPVEARSLRKSFLNTLIGIYSDRGIIKADETLESIGIDEKTPLTVVEKKATVADLLASRSGIFLPSAYDPNNHPERGLYKPGEVWHYNNWDFNALGTVFEKKTGKKIFEAFQNEIATPLKMQDFTIDNTEYRYEDVSTHPAYLFSTSARDDARIGLLWLNSGKWEDRQIVSQAWSLKSTSLQTDFKGKGGLSLRDGYGYLFWIDKNNEGDVIGYSALGNSGQFIYVNPSNKLIIVLRADPGSIFKKWLGWRLDPSESYLLVDLILDAAPEWRNGSRGD